ncbi:sugar phosphate isomerase/epimerase family protein [Oceanibium sediminis]|uniref:sugar phosphate isomerase/epimerase family protein n=1 Tax=Oceanibium sediminis TaxID=2026339 RepID=UPI000DD378E6|nr:sugar phosphate isomerase/epimerase [Oceanibium sediminis]
MLIAAAHTLTGSVPGAADWPRHHILERAAAAAAAGFDGLSLHFRDYLQLQGEGRTDEEIRAAFSGLGLAVPTVEFLPDLPGGGFDPEAVDAAFAATLALGAGSLNVGLDMQGACPPVERLKQDFANLNAQARERGVTLALEPLGWGATRDPGLVAEVLDHAGEGPGLVLDVWHLSRAGTTPADFDAGRILSLQICDAPDRPEGDVLHDTMNRCLCGEGTLDIPGFLSSVRGFDAFPLAVEVISPDLAAMPLHEAARLAHDTARVTIEACGGETADGKDKRPGRER